VVHPEGGIFMSDSSPSTALVRLRSDETMLERLALTGFLAGYSGPARESYRTDLRMFTAWLDERKLQLLDVHRTHIELYGHWLEQQGRARSTIGRRLSTLAGFYRYCEQEQILAHAPAANVRRPKPDDESRTLGFDRNELGAFLVAAGLSSNRDHALASPVALNGLRISEALSVDIEHLNVERGASHPAGAAQRRQTGDHPARAAYGAGDRSRRREVWKHNRRQRVGAPTARTVKVEVTRRRRHVRDWQLRERHAHGPPQQVVHALSPRALSEATLRLRETPGCLR
jgi:integrase